MALLLAATAERKVPEASWPPESLVQFPALPLARHLALGKSFSISGLWFEHLQMGPVELDDSV